MDASKKQETIAVFRYGLISPALHMKCSERKKYLQELVGKEFEVPYTGPKKYKTSTIRNWLIQYKNGGLDSLKPVIRKDKGIHRKITDKIAQDIKQVIEEFPFLSSSGIYRMLIKKGYIENGYLSESTLCHYIKDNNLRQTEEVVGRKKFEKENVNELWISDFMFGPYIKVGSKKRQTYLCAIIDDHCRMIVGWGWYYNIDCISLATTLKEAISIYGVPNIFYCDNGSVYVSDYLHLVCAKIAISLVHSKIYDSPSRGKIERFWKTVREKFLAGIDATKITLSELNTLFENWLETDYHKVVHSGIGEKPIDKYLRNVEKSRIKTISVHELDNAFLNVIKRKVKNDATVSVNKKLYEVPPEFIGKKVNLSFPIDKPTQITLLNEEGKPLLQLKEVNLTENANKPYTCIHFKELKQEGEINHD